MEKKAVPAIVFGKNLREKRTETGMTQERLAEMAEIDRTYIYRLENGKRAPSLSVVIKLAHAFKQSPGQFLDRMLERKGRV
jgi:transcriptional regulator with XRE-family HTH domain